MIVVNWCFILNRGPHFINPLRALRVQRTVLKRLQRVLQLLHRASANDDPVAVFRAQDRIIRHPPVSQRRGGYARIFCN